MILFPAIDLKDGKCVRLLRGDMRALPVAGGWGGIALFFTAFGYFDEQTNRACLAAWRQLLAPGGALLLDVPRADAVAASLVPRSERRLGDGSLLIEERRFDGHRVEKRSTIERPAGPPCSWTESVRIHDDAWWTEQARTLDLERSVAVAVGAAPAGRVLIVLADRRR